MEEKELTLTPSGHNGQDGTTSKESSMEETKVPLTTTLERIQKEISGHKKEREEDKDKLSSWKKPFEPKKLRSAELYEKEWQLRHAPGNVRYKYDECLLPQPSRHVGVKPLSRAESDILMKQVGDRIQQETLIPKSKLGSGRFTATVTKTVNFREHENAELTDDSDDDDRISEQSEKSLDSDDSEEGGGGDDGEHLGKLLNTSISIK